jgi:predicted NUDIX family NTP pyrophosphohydrolase
MIRLSLDRYIVAITKAEPAGRLKGQMVYKVISTDIFPLRERQIRDPDEDKLLALLRAQLKTGPMYFSYSLDITNSFQRQAQHDAASPLWQRADDRFFWNRFIQSDFINFRTRGGRGQPAPQPGIDPYILPVIFGVLEIRPTHFKSTPLTLVLITRRSRHRGGTRYFSRGLDDEGHASNYNETEQVVILNDSGSSGMGGFAGSGDMQSGKLGGAGAKETQILSYVQTRGSVPVYWAEINTLKYIPKIQIRGIETGLTAAKKHFDEQIRIYGDNYLVNLVNQKGREARVKQAYEQMVDMLVTAPKESQEADRYTEEKFHVIEPSKQQQEFDRLHYVYFDFHTETKGLQMHRAQLLVDRLEAALDKQQYFRAVDMPGSSHIDHRLEVRNTQTSVVRTNCMDCLDRTNVVQSLLTRHMMDRMFVDLGIMAKGSHFSDEDTDFYFLFRNMWADNADVVSRSYSGTGAMKTDLTRTGARTKAGALQDLNVAVTRYCKNNFLDGPRQDAFDLFLGQYTPAAANIGSSLIFADRRPVLIQSVPYVAAFSLLFVLLGMFSRTSGASIWPMRLFILFWLAVATWSLVFIFSNGMLYVSLTPPDMRSWVGQARKITSFANGSSSGQLAEAEPATVGDGGLQRDDQQGAEEQGHGPTGRSARERAEHGEVS